MPVTNKLEPGLRAEASLSSPWRLSCIGGLRKNIRELVLRTGEAQLRCVTTRVMKNKALTDYRRVHSETRCGALPHESYRVGPAWVRRSVHGHNGFRLMRYCQL